MQTFRKPKIAVLKRFTLHLSDGKDVVMHNVKVVKDSQRHVVHLKGNPMTVTLIRVKHEAKLKMFPSIDVVADYRPETCKVYAYSKDVGLEGKIVSEVPRFIERLLM